MYASSSIALFHGRKYRMSPPVWYYPPFSRQNPTVKNQIKSFLLRICSFSLPRLAIYRDTPISILYKRQAGSSDYFQNRKVTTALLGCVVFELSTRREITAIFIYNSRSWQFFGWESLPGWSIRLDFTRCTRPCVRSEGVAQRMYIR